MLFFHEVCYSSKIYLLIDGLKLENGILKEVGSNESDVLLAYLPSHSLGYLYDSESNREQFLYKLKAHDIFLKVSESVDSLNWYDSLLSIQKASQKI